MCLSLCGVFQDRVFLCGSGCSGTYCVDQASPWLRAYITMPSLFSILESPNFMLPLRGAKKVWGMVCAD